MEITTSVFIRIKPILVIEITAEEASPEMCQLREKLGPFNFEELELDSTDKLSKAAKTTTEPDVIYQGSFNSQGLKEGIAIEVMKTQYIYEG